MLGLFALLDTQYRIKSNRESRDGRYDISLIPREKGYPGIIMELEMEENLTERELAGLAVTALNQINEMRYDAEMREYGNSEDTKIWSCFFW